MENNEIKILIVEDHDNIRFLIKTEFEEHGYCVIEANSGKEALKIIGEEKIHIMLLDTRLENNSTGIEILKRVKQRKDTKDIYVIMNTIFGAPEDIERAKSIGVDAYLVKLESEQKDLIREINLAKKILFD